MARQLTWSGYTWDCRGAGQGGPGPNYWSDSPANISVVDGELQLTIAQDSSGHWTCPELDCSKSLGYGTYRWVVNNDLTQLDSHEVLGLFTYGGGSPDNNEIDIEPSHWGNLSWNDGSVTVWQDANAGKNISKTFNHTNKPPYVMQFTWAPSSVHWVIKDNTGATLCDFTVTSGVPVPSSEVAMINYWRFDGKAPASTRTMRLSQFAFAAPGQSLPALPGATPEPTPSPTPPTPTPPAPADTVTATLPVLKRGAAGTAVKSLQRLLRDRTGLSLTADGAFGSYTESALRTFQTSKNLTADGTTSQKTWERLIKG